MSIFFEVIIWFVIICFVLNACSIKQCAFTHSTFECVGASAREIKDAFDKGFRQ